MALQLNGYSCSLHGKKTDESESLIPTTLHIQCHNIDVRMDHSRASDYRFEKGMTMQL